MRDSKYYAIGALWTLALALPALLLALAVSAFFDRYFVDVVSGLTAIVKVDWQQLVGGFSGRWPEVVGILIGQLLLLAVLLIGGSRALERDVKAG